MSSFGPHEDTTVPGASRAGFQSFCRRGRADRPGVQGVVHPQRLPSGVGQDLRRPDGAGHVGGLRREGLRQDSHAIAGGAAAGRLQRRPSRPPGLRGAVRRLQPLHRPLPRGISRPRAADRSCAGPVAPLGPHRRHPLAGGDATCRPRPRRAQARHPAARDEPLPIEKLGANQARDVALLAAIYDRSTAENPAHRWQRLRKKLRFSTWRSKWDMALGIGVVAAVWRYFSISADPT